MGRQLSLPTDSCGGQGSNPVPSTTLPGFNGILSSTASVATVATTSSIHDHVTKDPEDNVGAIAANPAIE